jgi:hypothetical protein
MVLLGFLAVSCRQDPIFFTIASETAPRKPRIEGAPTNMVVFEREYPNPDPDGEQETITVPLMYVASGRLHWYAKEEKGAGEPQWDSKEYYIDQPGGKIIYLAVTSEYLYALCLTGHGVDTALKRIGRDSTTWETVTAPTGGYSLIQSIYADPEEAWLFAGVRTRSAARYAIFYLDETDDTFKMLQDEMTATLSGAVCRDGVYYLCTTGDGIYRADETVRAAGNAVKLPDATNTNTATFVGIIKLEDNTIIAVARNGGYLYEVENASFKRMRYTQSNNTDSIATGKYATGALALWEDYLDPGKKLLIAGIQGGLYSTSTSSYTNGYVEFVLTPDGSLNTEETRRDSNRLQSVDDRDRYTASLGKHPINHLFQTPREIDADITFFASTQTAGLWSYRNIEKNGGWQWNAEN